MDDVLPSSPPVTLSLEANLFNSILFLCWGGVALLFLLIVFRLFGRAGLVGLIAASAVLMNLLVTKSVTILGLGATGGNVLYAGIFLATDLISEYYGGRQARQAVAVGFLASLLALGSSQVTLLFVPAPWDWADQPLRALFTPVVRIVLGSMLAYLVSQTLDTYLYDFIRKRWKPLWLRNNGSTWVSQAVDTTVFCVVALLGTMPAQAWLQILLSTYLLKVLIAALDTPFIYLSRKWKPKELTHTGP
jgi:uncharacterized integral membrane protein (TIGR00697 family)